MVTMVEKSGESSRGSTGSGSSVCCGGDKVHTVDYIQYIHAYL